MQKDETIGNSADRQYLWLTQEIIGHGIDRSGRNGWTRGLFTREFRHDLRTGFPLLTTKHVAFKVVAAELLWFLDGGRSTGWRLDNNKLRSLLGYPWGQATIWSNDCENPEKAWVKDGRAQFPGDCGRIYGVQWRNWRAFRHIPRRARGFHWHAGGYHWEDAHWEQVGIDQIARAINLLKDDPYNRRNTVTAWNPAEIDDMCLPPCHRDFTLYVSPGSSGKPELLSLQMTQRSCDFFLGVPFNIASYALLLSMLAQVAGYIAHEIVITFLDAHIYHDHFDAVNKQLGRIPRALPSLWLDPAIDDIDRFTMDSIRVEDYDPHPAIKAPLL